ncbi:hypothetical protein DM860_004525 [Cuscuta australis]|uniref:Uncharacterized protein n=1 Tax=Cuscuta australis TaxID=267555 RepID=A0A328E7S9_9ASTE|nr:hypothetical protein DM860_004525 [Cuscuta australis]
MVNGKIPENGRTSLYLHHRESIWRRSGAGMNWTSEKNACPRSCVASPASAMSRRRVSPSSCRKFCADKWRSRI